MIDDSLARSCPVAGCGFERGTPFAGQYPCQQAWAGDPVAHRAALRGCRLSETDPVTEFGHHALINTNLCLDAWGTGPFVIVAGDGKSYRFEDSDRFGPSLIKKNGEPLANPWPSEGCAFWRAHRIWKRQWRRTEDGINCIWDEPKPSTARHIGGRTYMQVEAGEEDGVTLVLTSSDGTRMPLQEYLRRQRAKP